MQGMIIMNSLVTKRIGTDMKKGICPLCNGTNRVPVPESMQRWKHVIAGYDKETDTFSCTNCDEQYTGRFPTDYTYSNNDEKIYN